MDFNKLAFRALLAIPKIQSMVQAVKTLKSGHDKAAAVLDVIKTGNDVAETMTDRAVLHDPRVVAVLQKANDVNAEVHNVIAAVQAEAAAWKVPVGVVPAS